MGKALVECFIGLGSNLDNPAEMVRRAIGDLAATPGIFDVVVSPLYVTAPWGYKEQPDFVNAVCRVTTWLGPIQLVLVLQGIERKLGRHRTFKWGPREIDLDLLLYGDLQIRRRGLDVPHPRMHERAFVLVPLRDLQPEYRLPSGISIDSALASIAADQDIDRLDESSTKPLVR